MTVSAIQLAIEAISCTYRLPSDHALEKRRLLFISPRV